MTEGLAMRKAVFWTVAGLLAVVAVGSSVLWYRSYGASDQLTLRLGTPGVSVWTTDRGRLGVLFLGAQPLGDRWVMSVRSNPGQPADRPKLGDLYARHVGGFAWDATVNIEGLEMPAVSGVMPVTDGTWATRRVVVPLWSILAVSLGGLIAWGATLGVRIHRQDHGLCPRCAYDVSHCSHFCPKCGKKTHRKTWSDSTRPSRAASTRPRRTVAK